MTTQMQTLSVRIPSEDLEWLSGLQIAGAATPSDKLRALIAQMRKQHQGTMDYTACVSWLRELLSPFVLAMRDAENRHKMHSDAINAVIEWAPQVMATLLAERRLMKDPAHAVAVEEAVLQRCFYLCATLLRLGITPDADCYDPKAIEKHLPKVLELANLISADRRSRKET